MIHPSYLEVTEWWVLDRELTNTEELISNMSKWDLDKYEKARLEAIKVYKGQLRAEFARRRSPIV